MNEYIDRVIARLRRGWCQGAYARNSVNREVELSNKEACKWCLSGAMILEDGPYGTTTLELALRTKIVNKVMIGGPVTINDKPGRTLEEVIEILESYKDAA